ncbi:FHA domain-containing protein [Candidatus Woesearchaeota archaeon]|nr:FHA domain-containing protein [Candidatus Woesearchaeota archaeon]
MAVIISITEGSWYRQAEEREKEKISLTHVQKAIRFVNTTSVELKAPSIIIGRKDNCEIILDDLSVSRQHCRIYYNHEIPGELQWFIADLDSKNGTYILRKNKTITVPKEPNYEQLNDKDKILIGNTILLITVEKKAH